MSRSGQFLVSLKSLHTGGHLMLHFISLDGLGVSARVVNGGGL